MSSVSKAATLRTVNPPPNINFNNPFKITPSVTNSAINGCQSKNTSITAATSTKEALSVVAANMKISQQNETIKEITLKYAYEKKKNRIVFVESNPDFTDIILSFLTLPIGSIVNLLHEKSPDSVIGCTNNLYKSVGNLNTTLFRTEACKNMLLHPKRSSEAECKKLKLQFDNNLKTPKSFYICGNCRFSGTACLSEYLNSQCSCGQLMNLTVNVSEKSDEDEDEGVFVNGGSKLFLITDDMEVMPGLTSVSIKLLKKLGISDANDLEIRSFIVSPEKVLQFLGLSFNSKTPLTEWILHEQYRDETSDKQSYNPFITKVEQVSSKENRKKMMRVNFFICKSLNTVLYAECEEDFVDFLFSFLTIPLGSILKILDCNSQLGNFDNLYKSVRDFGDLKSNKHKDMLLYPKLAPYFSYENQFLQVEEISHLRYELCLANDSALNIKSFLKPSLVQNTAFVRILSVIDTKCPARETKQGGGFLKRPAKFMVTDNLTVSLLSPIEIISFIAKSNVPITDIEEISIEISIVEAKCLLKAALISKTALTDFFREKISCDGGKHSPP